MKSFLSSNKKTVVSMLSVLLLATACGSSSKTSHDFSSDEIILSRTALNNLDNSRSTSNFNPSIESVRLPADTIINSNNVDNVFAQGKPVTPVTVKVPHSILEQNTEDNNTVDTNNNYNNPYYYNYNNVNTPVRSTLPPPTNYDNKNLPQFNNRNKAGIPGVINPSTPVRPDVINPSIPGRPGVINPSTPVRPDVINPSIPGRPGVINPSTPVRPGVINPNTPVRPNFSNNNGRPNAPTNKNFGRYPYPAERSYFTSPGMPSFDHQAVFNGGNPLNQNEYLDQQSEEDAIFQNPYTVDYDDLKYSESNSCSLVDGCFYLVQVNDNMSSYYSSSSYYSYTNNNYSFEEIFWSQSAFSYRSTSCASVDCTVQAIPQTYYSSSSYSYAVYSVR